MSNSVQRLQDSQAALVTGHARLQAAWNAFSNHEVNFDQLSTEVENVVALSAICVDNAEMAGQFLDIRQRQLAQDHGSLRNRENSPAREKHSFVTSKSKTDQVPVNASHSLDTESSMSNGASKNDPNGQNGHRNDAITPISSVVPTSSRPTVSNPEASSEDEQRHVEGQDGAMTTDDNPSNLTNTLSSAAHSTTYQSSLQVQQGAPILCAACKDIKGRESIASRHTLSHCPFPTDDGDIRGCVICNTLVHDYDLCEVRARWTESERIQNDYEYCVVNRGGLPPVRSLRVNWPFRVVSSTSGWPREPAPSLGYPATKAFCRAALRVLFPFEEYSTDSRRRLLLDPKTADYPALARSGLYDEGTEVFRAWKK